MATDSYMAFLPYNGAAIDSESQVVFNNDKSPLANGNGLDFNKLAGKVFEVEEYSFDIEQTLNIGSQSSGAGAGKVVFHPFSITRKIDKNSPKLFEMACSGTTFKAVALVLRKGAGTTAGAGMSGTIFVRFDFKLVAVKTISWAHDDESPKETVTFEYGGLQVSYSVQAPDGSMGAKIAGGRNRVKNIQDTTDTAIA